MTQEMISFKKAQMFSCLFYDNMAQDSAKVSKSCGSSVVEHSLGKGEVESSILSRSTIIHNILFLFPKWCYKWCVFLAFCSAFAIFCDSLVEMMLAICKAKRIPSLFALLIPIHCAHSLSIKSTPHTYASSPPRLSPYPLRPKQPPSPFFTPHPYALLQSASALTHHTLLLF